MSRTNQKEAYVYLADGTLLQGISIGNEGTGGGELCFNTGMTGYQEIYTDPSYYGQVLVNTSPHIGNYGVVEKEQESDSPKISGLIVKEFSKNFSRNQNASSLDEYLKRHHIVGVSGLDTRQLVAHIRDRGVMNVVISTEISTPELLRVELEKIPNMESLELSSSVSTKKSYEVGQGNTGHKIAVLDIGIKKSILSNLTERNAICKVFPAKTPFSEMIQWKPDAFFISNGPGDPAAMDYAQQCVKEILSAEIPTFGICLGLQVLAKSVGISTHKMHHGHRGLNHPVKNLENGICEITSQNHGFEVDMEALKKSKEATLTHINLNDGSVEGLRVNGKPAFAVQYHPESSPGPHDSKYLFDQFIQLIKTK